MTRARSCAVPEGEGLSLTAGCDGNVFFLGGIKFEVLVI